MPVVALPAGRTMPSRMQETFGEDDASLEDLGIRVRMHDLPDELPDSIPFGRDHTHAVYDAGYAHRFCQVLVQADRVFKASRARFNGKCSPAHLFWGSNDLAVTRFSGRPAPLHPCGTVHLPDAVTR